jgi:hypothetical protein
MGHRCDSCGVNRDGLAQPEAVQLLSLPAERTTFQLLLNSIIVHVSIQGKKSQL